MRRREGENHALSSGFETNLTIFQGHKNAHAHIQKERKTLKPSSYYVISPRRVELDTKAFFLSCNLTRYQKRRGEEKRSGRKKTRVLRLRRRLLQILKWAEKCLLLQHRILSGSGMGRRRVKAELSCRSKHPCLRVGSPVFVGVGVGLDYIIRNHSWNSVVLWVLVIH